MQEKMSFVITSCGRVDLLNKTLESFFKFNSFKFEKLFLIEDSVDEKVYKQVKTKWGDKLEITLNKHKKGQIKSIEEIYKKVKTPFVFHCEDDWMYTRGNFVEESLKILKSDPKIIQVWLESESAKDFGVFEFGPIRKNNNIKFRNVSPKEGWEWGYFSFRPGVKRMSDYYLINGYQKFFNEIDIGLEYKKKGFYTVVIEEPAIIDLGAGRGCDDPTRIMPNRRKTNAPRGIKRLWKHIKTMKF